MIRLLRSVSILMLIFIAGLVAIVGLTYRNTNRFAYLFSNPDGTRCETPCLFGADPISMSVEQVDKFLSITSALKQAGKEHRDSTHLMYVTENLTVSASHDDWVASGGFALKSDFPTLGELLVLLGKPDRFWVRHRLEHDSRAEPFFTCSIVLHVQNYPLYLTAPQTTKFEGDCLRSGQKIAGVYFMLFTQGDSKIMLPWQGFMGNGAYDSLVAQAIRAD